MPVGKWIILLVVWKTFCVDIINVENSVEKLKKPRF